MLIQLLCGVNRLMYQIIITSVLIVFSPQTFAYLDPGTGSMILQGLIAGIAVAGFTIKTYWYRILSFVGKDKQTSLLEEEEEGSSKKEDEQ
mgnify:CR=1 FL=1